MPTVEQCQLWGVLNVTPDSFSDGGQFFHYESALAQGRNLFAAGASVVDIGGESTRPKGPAYGTGAQPVSVTEERARVLPVLRDLCSEYPGRISVDTSKAAIAEAALEAGVAYVNDVSGGADEGLLRAVAKTSAKVVLTHNRSSGATTDSNTRYPNLRQNLCEELTVAVDRALHFGVSESQIWVDPGLGFAKTPEQSLWLLANLSFLHELGYPFLVGPSRKFFLGVTAPRADGTIPPPLEREAANVVAVVHCASSGASAVRVHDVAAAHQALGFARSLQQMSLWP